MHISKKVAFYSLLPTLSSTAAIRSNIISERALRRCHNNGRAVQAAYRLEKRAADIEPHTDFAQIPPPRSLCLCELEEFMPQRWRCCCCSWEGWVRCKRLCGSQMWQMFAMNSTNDSRGQQQQQQQHHQMMIFSKTSRERRHCDTIEMWPKCLKYRKRMCHTLTHRLSSSKGVALRTFSQ